MPIHIKCSCQVNLRSFSCTSGQGEDMVIMIQKTKPQGTKHKSNSGNTNDIDLDTTYLTKCPVVDLMQHEPSYFEIVAQG